MNPVPDACCTSLGMNGPGLRRIKVWELFKEITAIIHTLCSLVKFVLSCFTLFDHQRVIRCWCSIFGLQPMSDYHWNSFSGKMNQGHVFLRLSQSICSCTSLRHHYYSDSQAFQRETSLQVANFLDLQCPLRYIIVSKSNSPLLENSDNDMSLNLIAIIKLCLPDVWRPS